MRFMSRRELCTSGELAQPMAADQTTRYFRAVRARCAVRALRGRLRADAAARAARRLHQRQGPAAPRRSGRQALQRRPVPSAEQEGFQSRRQEIRGSRPPAPVFGLGAQGAHHAGLCLLRGERIRRLHHRGEALRHAASGHGRRGLCAIPDRLVLFRGNPRRHPRPGAHRKGDAGARGSGAQISEHRIRHAAPRRSSKSRATSSPARKC